MTPRSLHGSTQRSLPPAHRAARALKQALRTKVVCEALSGLGDAAPALRVQVDDLLVVAVRRAYTRASHWWHQTLGVDLPAGLVVNPLTAADWARAGLAAAPTLDGHAVTAPVPSTWLLDVCLPGLATAGGHRVLDAGPLVDGVREAHVVTWLVSNRMDPVPKVVAAHLVPADKGWQVRFPAA